MNLEDIKKIEALDKDKFYFFRIGKHEWTIAHMRRFHDMCKREGIQGILVEANDFEVIEIDKKTYKLVKKKMI